MSDLNKFVKCKNDTEKLKIKINKLIRNCREFKKMEGFYSCGKLYGLPKIHKSLKKPPLLPIISMVGTVTHRIAKQIDEIIIIK